MSSGRRRAAPNEGSDDSEFERAFQSWRARRPQLFRDSQPPGSARGNRNMGICVIAEGQEIVVSLPNTIHDGVLQESLISRGKALATHGVIRPKTPSSHVDDTGKTHVSNATISLSWYYEDGLQTFRETFYVVDQFTGSGSRGRQLDAILRAGADPGPTSQTNPYYLMPAGQDPRRDQETKERRERSDRQYQAEKGAQQQKIRDGLTKSSQPSKKR